MLVTLGTIVVLPVILDYVGLGSAWPKQSSAASLAHLLLTVGLGIATTCGAWCRD
jgi:hypothetical protein